MSSLPYFSISKHSFEKNAGYKNTVHALAELIDNAFEADASKIAVILMTNRDHRLIKIAVVDNGKGMSPGKLQAAVCEKSGEYLDRQFGSGGKSRRKLGKYGVGLPKASISQCNKFSVWSWTGGGSKKSHVNSIDIEDEKWINGGAQVGESKKAAPEQQWLTVAGLTDSEHGTLVLWEDLDGITWSRTRWGQWSGLIPNLEFHVGRIYRKMLAGKKPDLQISVFAVNEMFKATEPEIKIGPNDPLYTTPNCQIPRKKLDEQKSWPPDDPLFEDITGTSNSIPFTIAQSDGKTKTVQVSYRRSVAKKNTTATLNGRKAGSLPHGEHAGRNAGLSILREGREVDHSLALATPNKPQERWFGVEFDIPHELDSVLGMTNNKQGYTRLDQVLRQSQAEFLNPGETVPQCLKRLHTEDSHLAYCLELAWKMQEVWKQTKEESEKGRVADVNTDAKEGEPTETEENTPEGKAEATASNADAAKDGDDKKNQSEAEKEKRRKALIAEMTAHGVPIRDAELLAKRLVERGLSYAILAKPGLGSPFFNVRGVVDAKIIELNSDHAAYPLLVATLDDVDDLKPEELKERLKDSKTTLLLMLEAWAKVESKVQNNPQELKRYRTMREDWGRELDEFVTQLETEKNQD